MTNNSPEMQDLLKAMFPVETARAKAKKCVFCDESVSADSFKDALSRKEYAISGMGQKCQDRIFSNDQE